LICPECGAYDENSMGNITLTINGESRSIPVVSNLLGLIRHLEIGEERIAVELNRNIIRRKDWPETPVHDGDRVEIVQFVGGG
jgi:sulfur carrier protein